MARARPERVPGPHQRLRHAGAAGVRRRDGRVARRPAERDRPQLVDGQRGAPHRSLGGRRAHRRGRRRVVLRRRRGELPRRHRVAAGDAHRAAGRRERARPASSPSCGEGLRYINSVVAIRSILLLLAFVSFTGIPYMVLMPIFAAQVLHGGPHTLGLLTAVVGGRRGRGRALARLAPRGSWASLASSASPEARSAPASWPSASRDRSGSRCRSCW